MSYAHKTQLFVTFVIFVMLASPEETSAVIILIDIVEKVYFGHCIFILFKRNKYPSYIAVVVYHELCSSWENYISF
jgi:hypothetical protein